MKSLRMTLLWGMVFILNAGFLGTNCNPPHVPTPPLVTTDPGGCTALPDTSAHSTADNSCVTGEVDTSEPNGTLFTALPLDKAACRGVTVPGRLAAPDDSDMFSLPSCPLPFLNPNDLTSHTTQEPRVIFTGDDDSEICLFASCDYGPTGLAGCSGDAPAPDGGTSAPSVFAAHLAEGMLGCCRRGSGTVVTRIGCGSLSPSASGYIVVRSVGPPPDAGTTCHQPYSVTFSIQAPPE